MQLESALGVTVGIGAGIALERGVASIRGSSTAVISHPDTDCDPDPDITAKARSGLSPS